MMRKSIRYAAAAALLAALCFGPTRSVSETAPSPVTATARVVARVNGAALTERDLHLEMERQFPFYRVHGGRVPAHLEPEIRKKALGRIIFEELLFQEARRRNIEISPQQVEIRINQGRQKFTSKAEFDRVISEQFGSEGEFRLRTKRALLAEALWNREVIQPARVSESEAQLYYRQNRQKYMQPESVWLQTISFMYPEHASFAARDQAKARAEHVLTQARAGQSFESFGVLAEKFSSDDWRVMNGDHGWVHRGTLDHELEVAFQLKPGDISGIISSGNGFYILRVNANRPAHLIPFDDVKAEIKQLIRDERIRKKGEQLELRLKSMAKIELR